MFELYGERTEGIYLSSGYRILMYESNTGQTLDRGKSIGDKKIGKLLEKDSSYVILLGPANQFG